MGCVLGAFIGFLCAVWGLLCDFVDLFVFGAVIGVLSSLFF